MSSEITDPEVLAYIERSENLYPNGAISLSIAEQRAIYGRMADSFRRPRPPGIAVDQGAVRGRGGMIGIRRYWPANPGAAHVVYFRGGGFVVGGLDSHDDICAEISDICELEVISVDYRLCPEHPHPAAYQDAMDAVSYFADRPLIVAGDSAGGNLAAAVALTTKERLLAQVLIYPGLGGEDLGLAAYRERAHARQLTTADVHFYRQIRAGGPVPKHDPTFAPLAASDMTGAPPCWVSTAEHDPLRDDGPAYVLKLREAGVPAETVVEPELPHGHLRARHVSARAGAAFRRVCDAISRFAAAAETER